MSDNTPQPEGKNPYFAALDAYGAVAKIEGGRDLEGRILLKAAAALEDLQRRLQSGEKVPVQESGDVLEFNQKLWQFFVGAMKNEEHPLPLEIKNNIASLGLFMFKRTLETMIDLKPEKLQAMIEINRNIAAGLLNRPKSDAPKPDVKVPGMLAAKPAAPEAPVNSVAARGAAAYGKQPARPAEQAADSKADKKKGGTDSLA